MGAGFAIKAKADQSAEIFLYEDVGEGWFGGISAKRFADELKALGTIKAIDLRINSYGGDVFDGFAIYQQLVRHPATVRAHIDGVAASIASVIAMAGDEIHIAEAGTMMIHDAWGMALGNAAEMRRRADLLDTITAQIAGVYEARTKQPLATLRAWMADEKWMTAAEALEAGFATAMSENLRMAAFAGPSDRHPFRRMPSHLASAADDRPAPKPGAEETALRAQVAAQVARATARRVTSSPSSR